MILLDSLYINNSGGKVLLDCLVHALHQSKIDIFYLLDNRCKGSYPFLPSDKTLYLYSSLWQRHKFYKQQGHKFNKILCFGNIPPSIKLKCVVYTYFHNVLLLEQPANYPYGQKILKSIKGLLIKALKKNTDFFIVQSENVKVLILKHLKIDDSKCIIVPFYRKTQTKNQYSRKDTAFVYISNANPHKNHENLLKAWEILYYNGINFPLHLTVTAHYPESIDLINFYCKKGLNIVNHGFIDVIDLYSKCKYSIYPSLAESFGLSLIESIESDTEVIAADLPYVDSIIVPLNKFNPLSPESIANAVISSLNKTKPSGLISKSKISNDIDKLVALLKN